MVPPLPNQVIVEMASRDHRMRHYLWHAIRDSWLGMTPADQQAIRNISPEWVPPRPAVDAQSSPMRDNDSGEDFLYMHHQMIVMVNKILKGVHDPDYPKVTSWKKAPPPGDTDYPVLPVPGQRLESEKTDAFYNNVLHPAEQQFTDPAYLSGVTLGQLGSDLEFNIHNGMHMRWSAPSPVGYRPDTPIDANVNASWDDPAYNYLGDFYSSHVNPIFWKLRGWVDDRITDWRRANNISGAVKWKGKWTGPKCQVMQMHPGPFLRATPTPSDTDKLNRVADIMAGASTFTGFLRP